MSDNPVPVPNPRTTPAKFPVAAGPVASAGNESEDSTGVPAKSPIAMIVLGSITGILLLAAGYFRIQVMARDQKLVQTTNRSAQLQSGAAALQTQIDETKAAGLLLQEQLDESKRLTAEVKVERDSFKSDSIALQEWLEKSRSTATEFQTGMAEAKVESIKRQGEVERAEAQSAVLQTQLASASGEMTKLQGRYADLEAQLGATQARVEKLETELVGPLRVPQKK